MVFVGHLDHLRPMLAQEALQRREPAEPRLRAVPLGRRQRRDEQRTDGGGPDRWQRAEGEEGALGRLAHASVRVGELVSPGEEERAQLSLRVARAERACATLLGHVMHAS